MMRMAGTGPSFEKARRAMATSVNDQPVSTSDRRSLKGRKVGLGFVVGLVVLALGLGVFAGLHTSWGTKQPRAAEGIAFRSESNSDLVLFDGFDGKQSRIYAVRLPWTFGNEGGVGLPPCLMTAQVKADIEVGYVRVADPTGASGDSYRAPLWIRCL